MNAATSDAFPFGVRGASPNDAGDTRLSGFLLSKHDASFRVGTGCPPYGQRIGVLHVTRTHN